MRFSGTHAETGRKHMIRKIRTLWRRILPCRAPSTEVRGREVQPETRVRRRVEVTVERETVSMLVRGQSAGEAAGTTPGETVIEIEATELPPAVPSSLSLPAPATEDPGKNQK